MIQFEPEEKILKTVRRHYFVIIPLVLTNLVLVLAPAILYSLLVSGLITSLELKNFVITFAENWGDFGYFIWLLLLWALFFIEWTDYYLDIWIITDKRIIDVEQKGFFHREVTSFRHEQIQDITVETRGLLGTFFKFGNLHIQTAGHERQIIIRSADNPEDVRSLILRQTSFAK